MPWKGPAIRDLCRIKFDESMPATPRGPPTNCILCYFFGIKMVSTKHKWWVHGQDSHCRRVISISGPLWGAVIISCLVCKKHTCTCIYCKVIQPLLINEDIHVQVQVLYKMRIWISKFIHVQHDIVLFFVWGKCFIK